MNSEIIINDKISLKMPKLEDSLIIYEAVDKDREHLRKWLPWVDGTTSAKNTEENIKKELNNSRKTRAFLLLFILKVFQ